MKISRNDWRRYVAKLEAINRAAAAEMAAWMAANPSATSTQMAAAAWEIVTRYGEASSALSCVMYDQIAAAQGAAVPPAEPAAVVSRKETSRAIKGTLRNLQSTVPATTSRLVKQAGADTMLQNAKRDRAEFAWIPASDSCPFCLMLASRGWQEASDKSLRYGHAPHIHANCDCEYAVRHDGRSTVEGYDPEQYYDRLYDADPQGNWEDRVNALRREAYKANKDEINEQKRIAYARRREAMDRQ